MGGGGQNNLHLKPTGRSPLKMRVPAPATAGSNKGSQTSDCENVSLVVGSPGSQVKSTKGAFGVGLGWRALLRHDVVAQHERDKVE